MAEEKSSESKSKPKSDGSGTKPETGSSSGSGSGSGSGKKSKPKSTGTGRKELPKSHQMLNAPIFIKEPDESISSLRRINVKDIPSTGRKVGILTSGGDSCGMNAAVRAAVRCGLQEKDNIFLIKNGYQGLIDDEVELAKWDSVSGLIDQGGTFIGTARCDEFRNREGRFKAAKCLLKYGIDNLIAIGGDGTLTGADCLAKEWKDFVKESGVKEHVNENLRIIGLLGSIDNDFCGSDMIIGVDSALNRISEYIERVLTTASSHHRTFVLEVMGRHCGYLTLMSSLAHECDYAIIPELALSASWKDELCEKLKAERIKGKPYNLVLVAEGGSVKMDEVKKVIIDRLKHDTRSLVIGHIQRGGTPSTFDRLMATRMGQGAYDYIVKAKDYSPVVICLQNNQIVPLPLMKQVTQTIQVGEMMKIGNLEKAVQLRGDTFARNVKYLISQNQTKPLPEMAPAKSLNHIESIAIVCCGAPCSGVNTALRNIVRVVKASGGQVLASLSGWNGIVNDDIMYMRWSDVNGITHRRSNIIGTRRDRLSTKDEDEPDMEIMGKLDKALEKYKVTAILIIGGFDGFLSMNNIDKALKKNPSLTHLNIPVLLIPATVSNNVPATDHAIGSDTATNKIASFCDELRVIADGYVRKTFVVERKSSNNDGFLTLMSGMASGADAIYIGQYDFTLETVQEDAARMRKLVKRPRNEGRKGPSRRLLIMRNGYKDGKPDTEAIALVHRDNSDVYSTEIEIVSAIAMIGPDTPFDKINAVMMTFKAIDYLKAPLSGDSKMAIVGLGGNGYKVTPFSEALKEVNLKERSKNTHWWVDQQMYQLHLKMSVKPK